MPQAPGNLKNLIDSFLIFDTIPTDIIKAMKFLFSSHTSIITFSNS